METYQNRLSSNNLIRTYDGVMCVSFAIENKICKIIRKNHLQCCFTGKIYKTLLSKKCINRLGA